MTDANQMTDDELRARLEEIMRDYVQRVLVVKQIYAIWIERLSREGHLQAVEQLRRAQQNDIAQFFYQRVQAEQALRDERRDNDG